MQIEGNPFSSYNWVQLIASMPISLLFEAYGLICSQTTQHTIVGSLDKVPENSILYLFHQELAAAVVTADDWTRIAHNPRNPGGYLGFHGFLSYMGSLPFMRRGWLACRYRRTSEAKPFDQITAFLRSHKGLFVIRTDAGGPYGTVRSSLVRLSIASNRPVVPVRQVADRSFRFLGHTFPLPGATITTHIGQPLAPEIFENKGETEGREMAQRAIDSLTGG